MSEQCLIFNSNQSTVIIALLQILTIMSAISYATFKSDFRINRRIGKGNCATVSQVYHPIEKRYYAHKSSQLSSVEQLTQAFNEIQAIKCIDDERTVKIYYYYGKQIEQTGKIELGIIMELCGLNLADHIKVRKHKLQYLEKAELRDFLSSFIIFFAKMQKKGYMHRDVKPDNILLSKNSSNKTVYKIADFGYAIKMNIYSTLNIAGTMEYVSPKLIAKFKDNKITVPGHNYKDDVYSFGKTFFQFMCLEINCNLNNKKLDQCAKRYGNQYSDLVKLMTKQDQTERPDFVYLENYLIRKGMIDVQISQEMKKTLQSLSSLRQVKLQSKIYQENSLQINRSKSKTKRDQKQGDCTKTKKRQIEQNDSATTIQSRSRSKTKSKIQMKKEEKLLTKSIPFGKLIFCMTACQDLVFFGSQAKFAAMNVHTEKLIKFTLEKNSKLITFMKVDDKKKNLLLGSLEGRFYIISISQIKKKMSQKCIKKSAEQILHQNFKYEEYTLENPISAFDTFRDQKGVQSFIFGHNTGQISILKGDQVYSQCSLISQPITCIKLHEGYVFFCNAAGLFKKQAAVSLGFLQTTRKEKNIKFLGLKCSQYKYIEQPFLTFEFISNCKSNDHRKEEHKYLAILISYDGFLHIVSNTMRCQKLVRISYSNILACHFQIEPQLQYGFKGWISDSQGLVYSQKGQIIENTERKNIGSIAIHDKKMFFGTYDKEIIICNRKRQAIDID